MDNAYLSPDLFSIGVRNLADKIGNFNDKISRTYDSDFVDSDPNFEEAEEYNRRTTGTHQPEIGPATRCVRLCHDG